VKRMIELRQTDYTVSFVEAEIFGKFAVHHSTKYEKYWAVTLISVGLSIRNKLIKKKAIELAKELDALDLEWPEKYRKGMGQKKIKEVTELWEIVKPILLKYGSIPE
jgi:hypothetical protein